MFKTNFKISNYCVHVFSSSAAHLEKQGAGGAGSKRALLPPCCSGWWLRDQHRGWGPAGSLCRRGSRACVDAPKPAGLCSSVPQRGREERQGSERELPKGGDSILLPCLRATLGASLPVKQDSSASAVRPGAGRLVAASLLCWPRPLLVLSPHPLHKECLIKKPRLDSLLIP